MTFIQTGPALARALADRNYTSPTPVQSAVLASETQDGDILVSAQTGSGKTIAYGLAIASIVLGDAKRAADAREPVALIVAPTRELALQVERELAWLYKYAPARIVACVGGMDACLERRKLSEGAQIVVGTPGRLRDHIERGGLITGGLAAVVLDEADEMLDLGFHEDLDFILEAAPLDRRTLMFDRRRHGGRNEFAFLLDLHGPVSLFEDDGFQPLMADVLDLFLGPLGRPRGLPDLPGWNWLPLGGSP